MDELYDAAEVALPAFEEFLADAASRVAGLGPRAFEAAPLKERARAAEKAAVRYKRRTPGPAESWVYDVVRGRISCYTLSQLSLVLQALRAEAEARGGRVLRVKNRCLEPHWSGTRDALVKVQLPIARPGEAAGCGASLLRCLPSACTGRSFTHVCEVQVRHRLMVLHDEKVKSMDMYKRYRGFFDTGTSTAATRMRTLYRLADLMAEAGAALSAERSAAPRLGRLVALACASEEDLGVLRSLEELLREQLREYEAAGLLSGRLAALSAGQEDVSRADRLLDIAAREAAAGRPGLAGDLAQQALHVYRPTLGDNHPKVCSALVALAAARQRQGRQADALALYGRACAISKAALGASHARTASIMAAMGAAYSAQGLFDEALRAYEKALPILRAALGAEHADVGAVLHGVADVRRKQGRLDEAAALFEDALRLRERALGRGHPAVAATLNGIASCKRARGDPRGALALYEEALRAYGARSTAAASVLNNMGLAAKAAGDLAAAEERLEEALSIRRAALGEEHVDVARTMVNAAGVKDARGDAEGAERDYEAALVLLRREFGEPHPDVAAALNNLGCLLRDRGRLEEARARLGEAAAQFAQVYGEDHAHTASARDALRGVEAAIEGAAGDG